MKTLNMGRRKKTLNPNEQLARAIIEQYQPENVEDMQNALKAIFPNVTVQRCIVHLIRNSIKYVPNKD